MSGSDDRRVERARARRRDPGDAATTTAAISASATTATSTSASATAAATTRRRRLLRRRTTRRATSTRSSGRSCGSRAPAASRRRIPSRAPARPAATSPAGRPPATKCQETFAWGLRNPFRFAFDPNAAGTRFFINDVGEGAWEEIDAGQAGADYGWNVREGPCANGSETNCGPPPAGMTNPIYAYSHGESGCARDHRRRVRPERRSGRRRTTAPTSTATTPAGRSSSSRRTAAAASRARSSRPDVGAVVNMTFGPSPHGQALYYTNYSNGGEVRRIEPTVVPQPAADGEDDRHAHAPARCRWPSASTAARAPIRMRATRSRTRGTSATGRRR